MDFSEVLDFWFGVPSSRERGRARAQWFRKNPEFDAEIRRRFGAIHESVSTGGCSAWEATPYGALALVIILDQFSRNMYRDSPRSFAADAAGLRVARGMIGRGFDRLLRPIERCFTYLPFEHSEVPDAFPAASADALATDS